VSLKWLIELTWISQCSSRFCGKYDTKSGKLVYSNAGHNPPLLIKHNRKAEWPPVADDSALGISDLVQLENREIHLAPGDLLLAYTDGVTEAMNVSKEFYGDDRFLDQGTGFTEMKPEDVVRSIFDKINLFCGCEPQTNDIKMLAMKIR
jgi:phosphoserine phosphatase RsbU/P